MFPPTRALRVVVALLCGAPCVLRAQQRIRVAVAPAFAPITQLVARELSGDRALSTVAFVEQYFRLPGNRGFDASIDTVAALLRAAGYVAQDRATPADRLTFRVESRPMSAPAWTPDDASLTIVGRTAPLLTWATNHNMLAINSYSTMSRNVQRPPSHGRGYSVRGVTSRGAGNGPP